MASLQHLAWDDFRLVKTIAEAGGLAGAAERLGVNHSTVFRRLGQIEEELGVKLFERHRTGYALTPAGEEMAALAERMEEDVATFARKLAGQLVTPAGELRVTTNDTLLVHLLTPIFSRFTKTCPDVRLDVVLDEPGPEPLEARRRRRDPRHRQPARDAGRPPRRDDRLGDLRPRRRFPAARRGRPCSGSTTASGWRSATISQP